MPIKPATLAVASSIAKEFIEAYAEFKRCIDTADNRMPHRIGPNTEFYWKQTVGKVAAKYRLELDVKHCRIISFELDGRGYAELDLAQPDGIYSVEYEKILGIFKKRIVEEEPVVKL